MKAFLNRKVASFKEVLQDKSNIILILAALFFLALNVYKITLFNYYMIPYHSKAIFKYKLIFTALTLPFVYYFILLIRSRVWFAIVYVLQVLYILINISYYMYAHSYIHLLQWVTLFKEAFISVSNFAEPRSIKFMIAFIDLPLMIYFMLNYSKMINIKKKLNSVLLIILAFLMSFIFSIELNNYKNGEFFIASMVNDTYKGESAIVQRYGTVANSMVSVYKNSNQKRLISRLKYGNQITNSEEKQEKPNFIFIQIESMDSNAINKKHNNKYISPYLHSLSENHIYYPYALSYHKGGGTSDVEFSVINSVEPLDEFPAIKLINYEYSNSFVKKLALSGYSTVAFHGNIGSFYNRDTALPKMGFGKFYDITKMNLKEVGWGAPDDKVFDFALNTMKTLKEPYLSYIITMTSHGPFNAVSNYYENSNYDDMNDQRVRAYMNSISYTDQVIEAFVSKVRATVKNAYIFIYGDHTPSINTEDYKQASFILGNLYFEFVPLIIITPDNQKYQETKKVAYFGDIAPTVMNISGTIFDIKTFGQNLLNFKEGMSNEIPYKGNWYDREELFREIKRAVN